MADMIRKLKAQAMVNFASIAWFCFFSFNGLWTTWATAMQGVDPEKMGRWDWFMTIGGCLSGWSLLMMAFMYKAVQRLASGHNPVFDDVELSAGGTDFISKQNGLDIPNPKDDTSFTVKNNGTSPSVSPTQIP